MATTLLALELALCVEGGAVGKAQDCSSLTLDQMCGLLRWTRYLGERGRKKRWKANSGGEMTNREIDQKKRNVSVI